MARVIVPYIIRQFYDTKTTGSAGIRAADLIIYPPEIAAYRADLNSLRLIPGFHPGLVCAALTGLISLT